LTRPPSQALANSILSSVPSLSGLAAATSVTYAEPLIQ
jgi:hypothetical protein